MNRIFKTIRNPLTGVATAVSEHAKGHITCSSQGKKQGLLILALALLAHNLHAAPLNVVIDDNNQESFIPEYENIITTPEGNLQASDVSVTINLNKINKEEAAKIIAGFNNSNATMFENNHITSTFNDTDARLSLTAVQRGFDDEASIVPDDIIFQNNTITLKTGAGTYDEIYTAKLERGDPPLKQVTFNNNSLIIEDDVTLNNASLVDTEEKSLGHFTAKNNTVRIKDIIQQDSSSYGGLRGITAKNLNGANIDSNLFEIIGNSGNSEDAKIERFVGISVAAASIDTQSPQLNLSNNQIIFNNVNANYFSGIEARDMQPLEKREDSTISLKNNTLKLDTVSVNDEFKGFYITQGTEDHSLTENLIEVKNTDHLLVHESILLSHNAINAHLRNNTIDLQGKEIVSGASEHTGLIFVRSMNADIRENNLKFKVDSWGNIAGINFEKNMEATAEDAWNKTQLIHIADNQFVIEGGIGQEDAIGINKTNYGGDVNLESLESITQNNIFTIKDVSAENISVKGVQSLFFLDDHPASFKDSMLGNQLIISNLTTTDADSLVHGLDYTLALYDKDQTPESSANITMSDNHLTISDSDIHAEVINGININFDQYFNRDVIDISLNKNHVEVADTTLNTDLNIATLNDTTSAAEFARGNISIIDNQMTLKGNVGFSEDRSISGVSINKTEGPGELLNHKALTYDFFSGNTLNYQLNNSLTASKISGFENYNFILNPELQQAHLIADTITLLSEDLIQEDGEYINKPSIVKVVGIKGGKELQIGEEFILMQATKEMQAIDQKTETTTLRLGVSLAYDVTTKVELDNKRVIVAIEEDTSIEWTPLEPGISKPKPQPPKVNPQLKALSEGNLAGLMLVTRGHDMMIEQALPAMKQEHLSGLNLFGITMGGSHRYNSGSHIKAKDFLMTVGTSYRQDGLSLAGMIDAAWSDYDTYNDFHGVIPAVNGDGNAKAFGLGVIGEYAWENGVYIDGSLRAGRHSNKFDSLDIRELGTGRTAHYSIKSGYQSAHIGAGYRTQIDAQNSLDFSGNYRWSRVGGKNFTLIDDPIRFDSLNSQRINAEVNLTHHYSPSTDFYAGVGYEYEFKAEAKGTTYHRYAIDAPTVKGSTGILNLGMTINQESNRHLEFNIHAKGSVGKRRGASLTLSGEYQF